MTEKEVQDFIDDLLDELKDVFRAEDIQMIENTRPLTDWTTHPMKIRERSVPVVYALEKSKFVKQNIYIVDEFHASMVKY